MNKKNTKIFGNLKGKEIMVIAGIIIVLLVVIIIGAVTGKKKDNNQLPSGPQTPEVGLVEENAVEEFVDVKLDGTKVNTSSELSKTKNVEGLEISNIKLTENSNLSQLTADVKNPTSNTLGDFAVSIKVLDKNGNELVTIGGYIDRVEAGKTVQLNSSATVDFANAYDFQIQKL